jgi:hypothetical protein
MTLNRNALVALLMMAPFGLAMAQNTTPQDQNTSPQSTSSQDQTSPNAASSPHQRATTKSDSQEAPATSGTEPSAAATPHQQSATDTSAMKGEKGQRMAMMKDCVAKEQAKDSSITKDQAKKTCKDQMKANSDSTTKKY